MEPRSTESERGYLTSLWKKRAGKNLYVHALPSFLSFSPDPLRRRRRRRRLIIVARQELKLFSWPVTSATPPPSFVVFVLALCRSLGGNFPAIRAHSLRLFLQAPFFLSLGKGKAFRRRHSYSSPVSSRCPHTPWPMQYH